MGAESVATIVVSMMKVKLVIFVSHERVRLLTESSQEDTEPDASEDPDQLFGTGFLG